MLETVPDTREHFAIGLWDSVLDESEPGPLELIRAQERASLALALGVSALSEADQITATKPWATQIERLRGHIRAGLAEGEVIALMAACRTYMRVMTADDLLRYSNGSSFAEAGATRMARLLHTAVQAPKRYFGEHAARADDGRAIFNMLHSLGILGLGEPVCISAEVAPVYLRAAQTGPGYAYDPANDDTFRVGWINALNPAQHREFAIPKANDFGSLPLISGAIAPTPLDELHAGDWFLAGTGIPPVNQDLQTR